MDYFEKPDFNPGGCEDRVDNRDFQWEELGGASPSGFDWTTGFDVEEELQKQIPGMQLVVKNQGGSFSCGGQAWAYYAEILEALATGTYEPRSAKYLYSQTCVPDGGSRGRDNADIFVNQGDCREATLTSYQNGVVPSEQFMQRSGDITDAARQDAKLSRASAYAQTGTDIESVATAIQKNHGVVLGVYGQNNGSWQTEFPQPITVKVWGHWIFACGAKMINGKKHIKVINSWGGHAGNNGRQWLSEDYFRNGVFSGWTHVLQVITAPVFKHDFQINMTFGDNNDEVKALQTALKIDGVFPITIPESGFYGNITRQAVLAFQMKYKVIMSPPESSEGRSCGPKTRAQLNILFK